MTGIWSAGDIVAALATFGLYGFYKRRFDRFILSMDAETELVHYGSGVVQFASAGSGPDLLFSHGGRAGYDVGLMTSRFLPDLRVISPSRFGYLRSSLPHQASPRLQADIYAHLLDTLEIDKTSVLAISEGGPSALHFAIDHADRCLGIVLLSAVSMQLLPVHAATWVACRLSRSGMGHWMASSLATGAFFAALGLSMREWIRFSRDHDAFSIAAKIVKAFPASLRSVGSLWDLSYLGEMTEELPIERIRCPVLIYHGTADTTVPLTHAQFVERRCEHAEIRLIENGSHFCGLAFRREIFPRIIEFVIQNAMKPPGSTQENSQSPKSA